MTLVEVLQDYSINLLKFSQNMIYNMKCKPLYSYNFVNRGININLINRKYSTICNENIGDNELEINIDKVELQKKEEVIDSDSKINLSLNSTRGEVFCI